jgi:hypothetical protein
MARLSSACQHAAHPASGTTTTYFDVLADDVVVGRIFRAAASPE